MYFSLIIISSLLSGLIGVIVSNKYYHKNEIRRAKLQVLQQLLGNRHDLKGQSFTEALNKILVVFYDSKEVLFALKEFHETIISSQKTKDIIDQKFLDLLKTMCIYLEINIEPLTDNYFLQAFNVKQ